MTVLPPLLVGITFSYGILLAVLETRGSRH